MTSGVRRSLALALIARIPIGALSLLVVLAVRDAGHPYAVAGLASGACALGMAISAPLMGRAADRVGQSVVLFASAVATAVSFAAFAALPDAAPPAVYAAVALTCARDNVKTEFRLLRARRSMLSCGFFLPPVPGGAITQIIGAQ